MLDRYYTPPQIATRLLEGITGDQGHISDFAAGGGSLLEAAAQHWPRAEVLGTDRDCLAVRALRIKYPLWHVGRCDLLNARSRSASPILARASGNVDLLLLNPPFSCRGGQRFSLEFDGQRITCSRAAAFIATGLGYLRKGGRM